MLRDFSWKSVYDSSEHDLILDLFSPLLKESKMYYRGVGFFTSGWLMLAAEGLDKLVENGGRAVFITSPHLEESDWYALLQGHEGKRNETVYDILQSKIETLGLALKDNTRTALAWMVADGVLEFKFAIPKNKVGNFHDKFGVFEDESGERIAIHGSFNDSIQATMNGESFSLFRSWEDGQVEYVKKHYSRFMQLYENANNFYDVYDMSDAMRKAIVQLKQERPRPYKLPVRSIGTNSNIRIPDDVKLYPFQRQAIDDWLDEAGRGMFEMATGTGKTFTSLASAVELHHQLGRLAIIVSAPFNHLVDQWKEDVVKFGFVPILCRENSSDWLSKLKSRVDDYNLGSRKSLFIITTHKTGSESKFTSIISALKGDVLYIADEVHYLGGQQYRKALLDNFGYRIGLSATPERWYDEEGSEVLRRYFGRKVADMPLEKAIGEFLTPYRFVPHSVPFTDEEMDQYNELSVKITRLMQHQDVEGRSNDQLIEHYLRKRAALVAKATNKLHVFASLLEKQIEEVGLEQLKHTIVYCAPGETSKITQLISSYGIRVHQFIYKVSSETRVRLLKQFESGDIQILVAIKCLDEGVNIPATKEAYFLASTSNPREFVQRRGRILRKSKDKPRAILHDLIVVPPDRGSGSVSDNLEQAGVLLSKEMPRFAEFCSAAENCFQAREVMYPILRKYGLISLIDKKPWDVYHESKKKWGENIDTIESDS